MKIDGQRAHRARRAIVATAIAGILAGCGQKGPLTLPSDALEPAVTETASGGETSDDEDRNED